MAFAGLKVSKIVENRIEVAGEFAEEEEAVRFAEDARSNDADEYEYIIERPPSKETNPAGF